MRPEYLTDSPRHRAEVEALLSLYLLRAQGDAAAEQAAVWAEIIVGWRAVPLPSDEAVRGPDGRLHQPSATGYTLAELVEALKAYASVLRTGEWPQLGSLHDHLRKARQATAARDEERLQALHRRALVGETASGAQEREGREAMAKREARRVIEALSAKMAMGGGR